MQTATAPSLPILKPYKDTAPEETILYFGYGSNMNETTHKWRSFHCESKFPCILSDHRLTFDVKGFALVEGAFANLSLSPGDCVHGLGMLMTKQQFLTNIKYKEAPNYEVIDIKVEPYDDNRLLNAVTLKMPNTNGVYLYPSRRYLDLLIQGAIEQKLKAEYIEYLKRFPDVKNSLTVFGIVMRIFCLMFYIVPFICFSIMRMAGVYLAKPPLGKLTEVLIWPYKNVPLIVIKCVPRSLIFKREECDPNGIRFLKSRGLKKEE